MAQTNIGSEQHQPQGDLPVVSGTEIVLSPAELQQQQQGEPGTWLPAAEYSGAAAVREAVESGEPGPLHLLPRQQK